MVRKFNFICLILAFLMITGLTWAAGENIKEDLEVIEEISEGVEQEQPQPKLDLAEPLSSGGYVDPIRYTLGPDDVVEIAVLRHSEFSGVYPINLEGKIQYKFVGDIDVSGLTKKELEDKIKEIISRFVINPEVNVTILDYKSKVIYVVGEVGRPGKYFMRSNTIPVREAVTAAGLPTLAAAMRRCRLVTPNENGKAKTKIVDLYALLYGGNLKHNLEMQPGDVLYVPSTIMAKISRVINPVTAPISSLNTGEGAAQALGR